MGQSLRLSLKIYTFACFNQKPISYYKTICKNFENNIDIYYAKINTETFLINSRRNYEKELEYNESLAERIQNTSPNENMNMNVYDDNINAPNLTEIGFD